MIGLYAQWDGTPVDPGIVARFAGSLAVGSGRPIGRHCEDGVLLARHGRSAAHARAWRAAAVPGGGLLLLDGFVANAGDLARALDVPADDDAALYAAGYAAWGDAIDLRMIGEFATIMVHPSHRRVRCARSPFHAPPLHVWHDRDRVVVASTTRALFASGHLAPAIDEQKIADSLYLNYADAERGWYRDTRRVPAGCRTLITPDRAETHRYHDPHDIPQVRFKRDEDYVEAARELLAEATHAALRGFDRPAVSLSGGFDSQAVAAFAIAVRGADRPLLGLTGVPEAGWTGDDPPHRFGDERAHVAALAAMYPSLETETIDAAGLSFDHKLDAMFLMAGVVPRNAMNLHWIHALRARAKARGCDVVLTGAMGNHGFSFDGSGALPSWLMRGRWRRLTRELRAIRGDASMGRTFASQAVLPLLPEPIFRAVQRVRGRATAGDRLESWCPLDPDYARTMRVDERARDMRSAMTSREPRSTRAYRDAAIGGAMTESGDIRQAMESIHGIPMRDPTAYRPLIEYCWGIPDDQYRRDGERRWLARRMLRGRVPDMVLDERRRGLQAADQSLRLWRDREALIAEIGQLEKDPAMSARLDLVRLRRTLEGWSATSAGDPHDRDVLQHALPRAIATARFIRFVEGANRG